MAFPEQYKSELEELGKFQTADAVLLLQSRNTVMSDHVAPIMQQMTGRWKNSEFCNAKDEQDMDSILFYASTAQIRAALVTLRDAEDRQQWNGVLKSKGIKP